MDFKQFLTVLRRRWTSIVTIILLALGVSAAITFTRTPMYESKTQIFLTVDVRDTTDAYAALLFASNRAASYATVVKSTELAERVIDQLDLDMTPEQLASRIDAEVVESTSLIQITVKDENPRDAQTIADVTTEEFTSYVAGLETPGGSTDESQIRAQITDKASYNASQVSPDVVLNLVVAALIGILLGIGLAVAREILDRTIRTADHVAELTESPVLASIGFDGDIRSAPLLTDLGGFAARTEAFRLLRTNLQFIDLDHQPRCLVITSAVPGEGKTMTSTNLAVALAQTGRNTLIIDADLRRPRVASTLGLDPAIGLTTALVGKTEIHDAIQVHEASGLHVLASGAKPPNPTEILQSKITHDLIRRLRSSYDMVIIDAPPLLPVADASVLAKLADGVIIVVRHAKTTKDQVNEAINRLNQVGARLYGVVVNMVAKRAIGSYYYYYYEETSPSGRSGKSDAKAPAGSGRRRA
ncbi:polysaccharide biosynthesis tyrosine autokinase [Nocardioides daeguensis]|uniref:non-specific protein-tyrosine kinase n=1 Tax=Nocardioides daeguensis TaxID=908359 RepID=A0ABP6VD10_9ACTN|nr:polysaccharide biosynthesis tyrosine autokinase [Nocardioides daeguensis]MBV6726199.1 polysaccharide biosynthesis tyrosine autokinase [Nocardioides daeguensis]MCR1772042.1 polysaccharide biosynthesis tyrosine autokinase [Nocardioides daeguensis]